MVATHASLEPKCNAQLNRLAGQTHVTLEGLQGCRSAVLGSEWFMPLLLPASLVFLGISCRSPSSVRCSPAPQQVRD